MQMKICSKCGKELLLENFYKNKTHKYGVDSICKECTKKNVNEYKKRWHKDNKEEISKYQKQYRQDNKEKLSQYFKLHQRAKASKLLHIKIEKGLIKAKKEFTNRGFIPLFEIYNGAREKLLGMSHDGYKFLINVNNLKSGITPKFFDTTNPYTLENIQTWLKINNKHYKVISKEYNGNDKEIILECEKHGEFSAKWINLRRGFDECKICNCVANTHPHLLKYFKNISDAYDNTYGSGKKFECICPDCGSVKKISISQLSIFGFSCNRCSDGKSYPEKIMFSVLEQLDLKFETQKIFKWSKNIKHNNFKLCGNKKYDFYIENNSIIIETHGLQHYKEQSESSKFKTLEEEQENDRLKKEITDNKINKYITIDCRKSELEFIKNNIMKSELPKLLNFKEEDIDWLRCHEFACNSLVKEVCKYYMELEKYEKTTKKIAEKFKICTATVVKYLKSGKELGWSDYDSYEEIIKKNTKMSIPLKVFKDDVFITECKSASELGRISEKILGVKLNSKVISISLKKHNAYKGFTFKYIENNDIKLTYNQAGEFQNTYVS